MNEFGQKDELDADQEAGTRTMDLLKKCQSLNAERKYDKVIALLNEKMDDFTPVPVIAEYAMALVAIRRSDYFEKYREARHAIEIIENECIPADYYPLSLRAHHAKALYETDNPVRAALLFRDMLKDKDMEDLPELSEYCDRMYRECTILSSSKVRMVPFAKRVELAWGVFTEHSQNLKDLMASSADIEDLTDSLDRAISNILHIAFSTIEFELSVSTQGKYIITICLDEHKERLFEYTYFVSAMPDELKDTWTIQLGRNSRPDIVMHFGKDEVSCDDLFITMEPAEEKRANLFVYRDKNLLKNADKDYIKWLYNLMVCMCLGEPSRYRSVKLITAVDGPIPKFAFPLSQLPKELESIGIEPSKDSLAYLSFSHNHKLVTPENTTMLNSIHLLPGTSFLLSQEKVLRNHLNEIFSNLATDGATFATIGFSVKESGVETPEDIDNFLFCLFDAMDKYDASSSFSYAGFSISPSMAFIDFIMWDGSVFLRALEKHMKDIDFDDYYVYNLNTVTTDFRGFSLSKLVE